jgi:hypothetical protein
MSPQLSRAERRGRGRSTLGRQRRLIARLDRLDGPKVAVHEGTIRRSHWCVRVSVESRFRQHDANRYGCKRACNRISAANRMSAADQTGVNSSYDVAWRYPKPRRRLGGLKMRCPSSRFFLSRVATEREKSPGRRLPGLSSFSAQAAFTARPYGTSSPARSQRASSAPTLHSPTAYPHDLRP